MKMQQRIRDFVPAVHLFARVRQAEMIYSLYRMRMTTKED